MIRRVLLSTACFLACIGIHDARAQARTIEARDGDVVLLPKDATITVARATAGRIRVAADPQGLTLVVLIDEGPQPDGIVDVSHRFELLHPVLPQYLGEANGSFEEFDLIGKHRGPGRMGIALPGGRILLTPYAASLPEAALPAHIAALQFKGRGSRPGRATFDDAERDALAGFSGAPRMHLGVSVSGVPGAATSPPAPPDGPVRVGSSIRQPVKIKDVPPVMPDIARSARIQGVVILEVTIDAQGRVSNARVLRSIPLLDQAALDAVRQWEYEPTLLNGVPVPIIMTVTVPFSSQ